MSNLGPIWSMPLKGVKLRYMQEQHNRLTIGLETEAQNLVCPQCGSPCVVGYGRMTLRIRDLPIEHKSVLLEIARRRLRCKICKVTFNEPVANIAEAHRTTSRLAQRLWQLSLYYPFTALGPKFGLAEKTLRNLFSDRFARTLAQFNLGGFTQVPRVAPRVLVLHRPLIQRQKRVLWLNADLDTLLDLNPLLTADRVRASLERLGQARAGSEIWLPPDAALIRLLQAQLPPNSPWQVRVHPAALRLQCHMFAKQLDQASKPILAELRQALLNLACATSAAAAEQAWHQIQAGLPTVAQGGTQDSTQLLGQLFELKAALEILKQGAWAAFDEPAPACDGQLTQLDTKLAGALAKRSFDAVCALFLFDRNLQVTARTGLASDGTHLAYQKAHYGTSLPRLLAKLTNLPAL